MPSLRFEILLQDNDVIAIVKPSGIAVIPGRGETTSVNEQLALQIGIPSSGTDDPRLRIVHRLDKETSGVMLFAKNLDAQRYLSHQFQNNTIEKEYLALVCGHPKANSGEIDAALAVHPSNKKKMAVVKHGGRPAKTLWQVEKQFGSFALLRLFPKTGKTHQIRVHLAHIGLPLAIDPLYNSHSGPIFLSQFKRGYRPSKSGPENPLIDRLTLHAEKLRFSHPRGDRISLTADLHKDFRAVLNMLGKYSPPSRRGDD